MSAGGTEEPITPFAAAVRILEAHYYTPAELAAWLTIENPQLGGTSPVQALAQGRADEVYAVVKRLDDGVYL